MNKIKKYVILSVACFLFVLTGITFSGQNNKISVFVEHTGEDTIGNRVAYEVKEKISTSARFRLLNTLKGSRLSISIVSLDIESIGKQGILSALSVTYVLDPYVMNYHGTSEVIIVGKDRVKSTVGNIVASADKAYHDSLESYNVIRKCFLIGLVEETKK